MWLFGSECAPISAVGSSIEDYALIGNMLSVAFVCRDGSTDWLCLPRFDSPACFAALLGTSDNGRWKIAPVDEAARTSRRYVSDTGVLKTRFETATGVVTLTDFVPVNESDRHVDLIRIVAGVEGSVEMAMELALRFENGRAVPWVQRKDYGLSAIAGPNAVELHTPVPGRQIARCSPWIRWSPRRRSPPHGHSRRWGTSRR